MSKMDSLTKYKTQKFGYESVGLYWTILQGMGRKVKYKTEEEKRKAQLKWSQNYYLKNRQRVLDKAKQRYANKKSEQIKKELYGE